MAWCEAYFDILNCLVVIRECERQIDREMDGQTLS